MLPVPDSWGEILLNFGPLGLMTGVSLLVAYAFAKRYIALSVEMAMSIHKATEAIVALQTALQSVAEQNRNNQDQVKELLRNVQVDIAKVQR